MKSNRLSFSSAIALAALTVISSPLAEAQKYDVEAGKPEFEDLPSPDMGNSKKGFKPKDWLEIEAGIKLKMAPAPPSKTADKITVKWYVAVANPDKQGTYLLLTKEITHVNIPLDEEIFSSVYLSPASVRRITGTDRAGKSSVFKVGYEVLVNGEKRAEESSDKKPGWWNSTSENLSRSEVVPLLDKSESAFASMWWDRYAEILRERR